MKFIDNNGRQERNEYNLFKGEEKNGTLAGERGPKSWLLFEFASLGVYTASSWIQIHAQVLENINTIGYLCV